MTLLGSTKYKTTKDKIGENESHLEITEIVLVHDKIVNNDYQQDWRVFYTFVSNISSKNVTFFKKTFDSEFSYIEVWLTDQCSKPLEIK